MNKGEERPLWGTRSFGANSSYHAFAECFPRQMSFSLSRESLYPKLWYVYPKLWDVHPKVWDVYPKVWDIKYVVWE